MNEMQLIFHTSEYAYTRTRSELVEELNCKYELEELVLPKSQTSIPLHYVVKYVECYNILIFEIARINSLECYNYFSNKKGFGNLHINRKQHT